MSYSRKIFGVGLIGPGILAFSAVALADSHFGDLDANGDDRITLYEWRAGVADMGIFEDRDENNDDRIDENEFAALDLGEDFDAWDANDNSYLDRNEYYEGSFEYFDEDENGHWDGDERDDAGDRGFWDV